MPRGDTGQGSPHLGAYGVALAIVLCTIIAGILAYSSGRESERRDNAPASYSRAAKQDAQSSCVGMETGAAFECIYEKVEASQEQAHDEQDLSAQQRAAFAAVISALVAFLTLGATGLGVWYVKRTLDATLEAVKETGDATQLTRDQFDAAFKPILKVDGVDSMVGAGFWEAYNAGSRSPMNAIASIRVTNVSDNIAYIVGHNIYSDPPCQLGGQEPHFTDAFHELTKGESALLAPYAMEDRTDGLIDVIDPKINYPMWKMKQYRLIGEIIYQDSRGIEWELGFQLDTGPLWRKPPFKRIGGSRWNYDRKKRR